MAPSLISVEDLLASFQPTTKIIGRPDYNSLRQLRTTIKQNAASIHCSLGGGNHGYLALTVSPTIYATISNTPFVVPADPGPYPNIADGATAAQIGEATRIHAEQTMQYQQYNHVQYALCKQIQDSVDPIFLLALKEPHIGLANRTTLNLLDHLFTNYAVIHPTELSNNDNNMKKPWNPADPFEVIIDQIDQGVEFASDGNAPLSAISILNTAYALVFNCGAYHQELVEWDNKPANDRATWAQFKTFMLQKQMLRNRRPVLPNPNAAMMGYYMPPAPDMSCYPPNGAFPMPYAPHPFQPPPPNDTYKENAAPSTNDQPDQFAAATTNLETRLAELTALVEKLATGKPTQQPRRPRKKPDPNGYCWTHGYVVSHGHNSKTCNSKADGHQDEATRTNTLRGSTRNQHVKLT